MKSMNIHIYIDTRTAHDTLCVTSYLDNISFKTESESGFS